MNSSTLAIASDFVKSGIETAGIPLTHDLEAYLSLTFARFLNSSLHVDMLTIRISQAMDEQAGPETIRDLADTCLIACAFFEERLLRNGTIRHYVGLGQMTYDAADMPAQAYGFMPMRDVMASAAGSGRREDTRVLIDRALAGSKSARADLREQNVVVGPWQDKSKSGILWN